VDVRRLHSFATLAEHLNFSRAAEVLNTSQPALSHQIASLERELGVRLFERTKRQVRLTAAGIEYLEGIGGAMRQLETSADRARDAQAGLRGTLSLAVVGMVMIRPLPAVVRAFSHRFPQTRISIAILRHPDPFEAVRSNRAHLAFAVDTPELVDLEREVMWSFPYRAILPADHPLARHEDIDLNDLAGETLITPPSRGGSAGGDRTLAVCREVAFAPAYVREVPETADVEAIFGLVTCRLGFGILPGPYESFALPNVVFKPIRGSRLRVTIAAFWRQDHTKPLVVNFLGIARTTGDV
jgi:DNA-binding transcriptional LysR family regulator